MKAKADEINNNPLNNCDVIAYVSDVCGLYCAYLFIYGRLQTMAFERDAHDCADQNE